MENKRLEWIDWAKIIGMVLVILGHMSLSTQAIDFIYSFHMPLFFLLSGYLEKNKGVSKTMQQGWHSLLLPYLLLCLLSYPWWYVVSYHRHPELFKNGLFTDALLKPFLGVLSGVGYSTKMSTVVNIPLWFLVGLFWCRVFNSVILQLVKNNTKYYLFSMGVVVGIVLALKALRIDLLFSLDSALLALPFFAVGYTIKKADINLPQNKWLHAVVAVISIPGIFFIATYSGRVDINLFNFGPNILVFYLTGLLGALSVISLSFVIKELSPKLSVLISSGTLLILAFHWMIVSLVVGALHLGNGPLALSYAIPIAIAVMVLMIPPILFAKRWFPVLLGKRKLKLKETPASPVHIPAEHANAYMERRDDRLTKA